MMADGITIGTTVVTSVVTALWVALVFMFRQVVSAKDKVIADLERTKESYREIASEAVKSAKDTADYYRGKYEDKAPIILAPPVVSESHSPSTALQREAAVVATLRAGLAMIKQAMGQAPRREPDHQ